MFFHLYQDVKITWWTSSFTGITFTRDAQTAAVIHAWGYLDVYGAILFNDTLSITFAAGVSIIFPLPDRCYRVLWWQLAQWSVTYLADLSASTARWTDAWFCPGFCLRTMTFRAGFLWATSISRSSPCAASSRVMPRW